MVFDWPQVMLISFIYTKLIKYENTNDTTLNMETIVRFRSDRVCSRFANRFKSFSQKRSRVRPGAEKTPLSIGKKRHSLWFDVSNPMFHTAVWLLVIRRISFIDFFYSLRPFSYRSSNVTVWWIWTGTESKGDSTVRVRSPAYWSTGEGEEGDEEGGEREGGSGP